MMPKCSWRGEWYIYHTGIREFLRYCSFTGGVPHIGWTKGALHAKRYRNPSAAKVMVARINETLGWRPGAVQVVTAVTGEAARCLDAINRRGG